MSKQFLLARIIPITVVMVFVAVAGIAYMRSQQSSTRQMQEVVQSAEVVLYEDGYEPSEVTIKRNGVVTFSTTLDKPHWPASNLHPSHEIYAEFDPLRPLDSDEPWSFTFDRAGTFHFHDHLRSYFVGTVYVVE